MSEPSLPDVLGAPASLELFVTFCEGIFSDEHLKLWLACRDYALLTTEKERRAAAAAVQSSFLSPGGDMEVEMDSMLKRALSEALSAKGEPLAPSLLQDIQARGEKALLTGQFPRFLRSDAWTAYAASIAPEEEAPLPEPDLLEVLHSGTQALEGFHAFLRAELASETLEFWLAVTAYSRLPRADRVFSAPDILTRFITEGAAQEVELPFAVKQRLEQHVSSAEPLLFDEAAAVCYRELLSDFPRFLQSPAWRELVHSVAPDALLRAAPNRHATRANADELGALLLAESERSKRGFLFKRGEMVRQWRRRWCVLSHELFGYFDDQSSSSAKGVLLLSEVLEVLEDVDTAQEPFVWALRTAPRTFRFQSANERDRQRWLTAIKEARAKTFRVPAW